jgi:hypothetical protein
VKQHLKKVKYRKYKEIYQVNINIIKAVIRDCDCSIKKVNKILEKNIQNGGSNNQIYMLIPKGETK